MNLPSRTVRMLDIVTALTRKRRWVREHVAIANRALAPNRVIRPVDSPAHIRKLADAAHAWFEDRARLIVMTANQEHSELARKAELLHELEYVQFMYPPGADGPRGRYAPNPRNVRPETMAQVIDTGRSAGRGTKGQLARDIKKHQRRLEWLGTEFMRVNRQIKKARGE